MEDYRLDQSGQEVQDILNGAAMQVDLTAETERATEAEQTLQGNIDDEATRAQGAEGTLQGNIDAEEARAKAAEKQNADDIDAIEEKIPSGASVSNKLATEEYVNDSVATSTATFRGTYNVVTDLGLTTSATHAQIATALAGAILTADNNDYAFVLIPTSAETPSEIASIERYKFNGAAWGFEYVLNNSGFTAVQWAAINSGITSGDVTKLKNLPTNDQLNTLLAGLQSDIDGEATRAQGAEGTLQGNIDAEETRAKAAEKQNADDIDSIEAVLPSTASSENKVATESEINSLSAAIEAILLLIPSAATSLNKLADKAFVNSSIATATATFRGTYNLVNDLGLTTSATHAQIATALAGAILTADNNDYAFVQIPTSDAMPTEIAKTERYKFNGTAWEYEYDLNNSGFTADQWAAINSGITQALVTKLEALPTNAELTTELGTLTSGITAINQKIPNAASQANKLVDTAAMEAYIVQVLDVLTISYNVTSTDGHVTLSIEQVDGKITSVTLTTSDIASAAALNLKASQADLTALASRVTTAEGNITTLGGRMTTAEGNITSLGGRVSTNETDIANLQQLYNDLQQSKPIPVDALPETGQQQGVIYRLAGTTSYSDYMWNGSTWVLMATYNNAIDPRPKKASLNLVTSGGVFDNMGALDVSELNATENPHTLAQYVDLSAALAAISTDYQKGGMSIKFVQSSDNKYVQFRLMANAFTTDVAQWQGVDDVPTAGSDNLVKSGGVASVINDLALFVNKEDIDIQECSIFDGGFDGDSFVVWQQLQTAFIYNNNIKSVKVKTLATGSMIAFTTMYPASTYQGTNVGTISTQQLVQGINEVNVPSNARYVAITTRSAGGASLIDSVVVEYDDIALRDGIIKDNLQGKFINSIIRNNGFTVLNNTATVLNGYDTKTIECEPNKVYKLKRLEDLDYAIYILKTRPVLGEALDFASEISSFVVNEDEFYISTSSDAAYLLVSDYNRPNRKSTAPLIYDVTNGVKEMLNIDVAEYIQDGIRFNGSSWVYNDGTYKSALIPVKCNVVVIGNSNTSANISYAFMVNAKNSDRPINISSVTAISAYSSGSITVPEGAEYIYLETTGENLPNLTGILFSNIKDFTDAQSQNLIDGVSDGLIIDNDVFKNYTNYKGCVIPVIGGMGYLVKANATNPCRGTWLTGSPVENAAPSYSIGEYYPSFMISPTGQKIIYAPLDAKYLYFDTKNTDLQTPKTYRPDYVGIICAKGSVKHQKRVLYIAASDSSYNDKLIADFVCSGTNDEKVIQNAIDLLSVGAYSAKDGEVILLPGNYYIDSFNENRTAIKFPGGNNAYADMFVNITDITVRGSVHDSNSIVLHLSSAAYSEADNENEYKIFGLTTQGLSYNHHSIQNLHIVIPSAQKKIICVDASKCASMECINLYLDVEDRGDYENIPSYIPEFGCIGIRGTAGANNGCNYMWKDITAFGFGQGFAVGGEHILMISCGASFCRYGYTFNSFLASAKNSAHRNTFINCGDEANMNLPLFCTLVSPSDKVTPRSQNEQAMFFYGFNFELHERYLALEGNLMTEQTPGQYTGVFQYSTWTSEQVWAEGSGLNFDTRNFNALVKGTTVQRLASKSPQLAQFWDTTLNKMCYLVDRDNNIWKDAMGNIV